MLQEAVLLLGPTGVGKSPLGDALEEVGFQGRRCHHFDFGAHLRAVGAGTLRSARLSDDDVAVVRRVLETSALLEDDEFAIAEALLRDFLVRLDVAAADLVVLNGLPRHVGQAEAVGRVLDVTSVIHLDADAADLVERIRLDSGGDRAGREDDELDAVAHRLALFDERTRPLLAFYGARVRRVEVGVKSTAADLLGLLGG